MQKKYIVGTDPLHQVQRFHRSGVQTVTVEGYRDTILSCAVLPDNNISVLQAGRCLPEARPIDEVTHVGKFIRDGSAFGFQYNRNLRKCASEKIEEIQVAGNTPGIKIDILLFLKSAGEEAD